MKQEIGNGNRARQKTSMPKKTRDLVRLAACILAVCFLAATIYVAIPGTTAKEKEVQLYEQYANQTLQASYQDNEFFKNGVTHGTGIVSSLLQSLQMQYDYQIQDTTFSSHTIQYEVQLSTIIQETNSETNAVLYTQNQSMIGSTDFTFDSKEDTLSFALDIPFQELNSLVERFRSTVSVTCNAWAEITLRVTHPTSEHSEMPIEAYEHTTTIPLGTSVFSIETEETGRIGEATAYENIASSIPLPLFGSLLLGFLICGAALFYAQFYTEETILTPQETELEALLKTAGDYLVETAYPGFDDSMTVFPVHSIETLRKLADESDLPIMHYQDGGLHTFCFVLQGCLYLYEYQYGASEDAPEEEMAEQTV